MRLRYEDRERDMRVKNPYWWIFVPLVLLTLLLWANVAFAACTATVTEQYSAAPADSVGRVYPFAGIYNGANTQSITVAGTTIGVCSAGDVTVGVVADSNHATTVVAQGDAALGSGTFTRTMTVPAGRLWYVAKIVDTIPLTTFQARRWGVGVLVLTIGQSNMAVETGETGAKPAADGLSASFYTPRNTQTNNTWGRVVGNGFIQAANRLGPVAGYVVGFTQYAETSTSIANIVTLNGAGAGSCGGAANGSTWTNFTSGTGGVTNATSGPNIGTDFNAVLYSQGETDASAGTPGATFKTRLGIVVCQLHNLSGRDDSTMAFIVDVLGSTTSYQTATDATWDAIRQAQLTSGQTLGMNEYVNWQGNGAACTGGANQSPHWLQGTGGCFNYYEVTGYFQAEAVLGAFGINGYQGGGLGPLPASATKNDTTHVTLHTNQYPNASKLCDSSCTGTPSGSTASLGWIKVCANGSGAAAVCTGGVVETVTALSYSQPSDIILTVSPAYNISDVITVEVIYGFQGNVTTLVPITDDFNPFSNPGFPGRPLQPTVGNITATGSLPTPEGGSMRWRR